MPDEDAKYVVILSPTPITFGQFAAVDVGNARLLTRSQCLRFARSILRGKGYDGSAVQFVDATNGHVYNVTEERPGLFIARADGSNTCS